MFLAIYELISVQAYYDNQLISGVKYLIYDLFYVKTELELRF